MNRLRVVCLLDKSPLPGSTGSRVRIRRLVEALASFADVAVLVVAHLSDDERRLLDEWDVGAVLTVPPPHHQPTSADRLRWLIRRRTPARWLHWDADAIRALVEDVLADGADLVWTSGPGLGPVLPDDLPAPLVVDVQGLERAVARSEISAALRSLRSRRGWRDLVRTLADRGPRLRTEQAVWDRAAMVTPVSADDAERIPASSQRRVVVVPNGATIPEHVARTPVPGRLLFVGNLNYPPNLDAVHWIGDHILPMVRKSEACVLRVVGQYPQGFHAPRGVELLGFLPDLDAAYATATMALLPLRAGTGTKVKVIEACAHGVPVITTPVGAEGLPLDDGEHLVVRPDVHGLADAVVTFLRHPMRAEAMGARARAAVQEHLDWSTITARFAAEVADLVIGP